MTRTAFKWSSSIREDEPKPFPSKGWAAMIRKVYEVNPMLCPECDSRMRIIAFLTDYSIADRIIRHLKLTFVAEKPPPPRVSLSRWRRPGERPRPTAPTWKKAGERDGEGANDWDKDREQSYCLDVHFEGQGIFLEN